MLKNMKVLYCVTAATAMTLLVAFPGCKSHKQSAGPAGSSKAAASPAPALISSPSDTQTLSATKGQWTIADEFDFDWQRNGIPAHFLVEQNMVKQVSRITVRIKGQPDFVVDDKDGVWDAFENAILRGEDFLSRHKNLAPSKYAYSLAPSASNQLKPLVFLVNAAYASDPERLYVFGLDSSGRPKVLLNTLFHIREFRDLDGDGVAEIVGWPCFSQGWGHDFLTYVPYQVYQLQSSPELDLKLSLPLTQEYNEKNYYGWKGPDCSEKLTVVLHPPGGGKPVVVPSKEAEKMFENKK